MQRDLTRRATAASLARGRDGTAGSSVRAKALLLASLCVLGWASIGVAEAPTDDILIVQRSTHWHLRKSGKTVKVAESSLPRNTLLKILPQGYREDDLAPSLAEFYSARLLEPSDSRVGWVPGKDLGWVAKDDVINLTAVSRGILAARTTTLPEAVSAADDPKWIPALIQRESKEVHQDWAIVQRGYHQNDRATHPRPEPYFDRGDFLALVGGHEDALRDYLKGAGVVIESGRDLLDYSRQFLKLHHALENRVNVPRPPYYGDAWIHFGRGCHAYSRGDLQQAKQLFDNATQLGPGSAIFWYYRALTQKRLGQAREAERDLTVAVHLEMTMSDPALAPAAEMVRTPQTAHGNQAPQRFERNAVISQQLERIQGELRLWLESFRTGTAVFQVRRRGTERRS